MPIESAAKPMSVEKAFAAGNYGEVCRHYQKTPPTAAEDWLWFGRAQLGCGQADQALECFHQGLRLCPKSVPLQYFKACALARSGQWQGVESSLSACLNDPSWRQRALCTRAQARVRAGLWAQASEDYLELNCSGGLTPRDRLGLAACLVQLTRWQEADKILEPLFAEATIPELAWLLKGRCLEGKGSWTEAANAYRKGLERYPESAALAARLLLTGRRPAVRRPEWLLCTFGGRQMVLADWLRRQTANPSDLQLAHRVALLASFGAQKMQSLRPGRARELWRIAFANWALLLDDEDWKTNFMRHRGQAYGRAAGDADREEFNNQLAGHMEVFFQRAHGDQVLVGEPSLRELWLRERQAIGACRRALPKGGFVLGDKGKKPLACGPLLLSQLGLAEKAGEQLSAARRVSEAPAWLSWPDPDDWHQEPTHIRVLFSALGLAQAKLETGDPRGALESLRWAICPACAATVARGAAPTLPVCRADCRDFVHRNPGFAGYPDRADRLRKAAQGLRLQAVVAVANHILKSPDPSEPELAAHWKLALELVGSGPRRDKLLQYLVETVLSRARGLQESNRPGVAVRILDCAGRCLADSAPFEGLLALALTDWGIAVSNEGDPEAGMIHLERAVMLAPHLHRARTNLVRVLQNAAQRAANRRDFSSAQSCLEKGERLCRADIPKSGAGAEFEELAEGNALTWLNVLAEQAAAEFAADNYAAAATALEKALQQAGRPFLSQDHKTQAAAMADKFREYLVSICLKAAKAIFDTGDAETALRWLERARSHKPKDDFLQEQIQTVRAVVKRR